MFFYFNDTATTQISTSAHTLSLHDVLPIYPHTRLGHYPVLAEEESEAIVKEMRVEAPSDEAGRHRIGNPIDGDGAVAGDIDGDHGEIGGSPCGQRLEYPAFCIDARSMSPVLSGDLRLNELAPGLDANEIAAAPPA